jgi:DNA-binding response OmpR family regulator
MPEHKDSILLVEDDAFLRDIFGRKLRDIFQLHTTDSGKQAIEIAREHKPVAILLDLNLPEENGFDILRQIRADKDIGNTLVLILTNSVLSEDAVRSNELKADDFLTKADFSTDEIIARISSHLNDRQFQPESEQSTN